MSIGTIIKLEGHSDSIGLFLNWTVKKALLDDKKNKRHHSRCNGKHLLNDLKKKDVISEILSVSSKQKTKNIAAKRKRHTHKIQLIIDTDTRQIISVSF
jgi:hypothetical protein